MADSGDAARDVTETAVWLEGGWDALIARLLGVLEPDVGIRGRVRAAVQSAWAYDHGPARYWWWGDAYGTATTAGLHSTAFAIRQISTALNLSPGSASRMAIDVGKAVGDAEANDTPEAMATAVRRDLMSRTGMDEAAAEAWLNEPNRLADPDDTGPLLARTHAELLDAGAIVLVRAAVSLKIHSGGAT